jgi:molybdopterin molybdotransferase
LVGDKALSHLLSVAEAQAKLLAHIHPLGVEIIPLKRSTGRVLAEPVLAMFNIPPFNNSSMDGFALRAIDTNSAKIDAPITLEVIGDIPAGFVAERPIAPGQAQRIMTGAPLPSGADAVIPVEDTDFHSRQPGAPCPSKVKIFRSVQLNENIRPMGQDAAKGEIVLEPGYRIRPQDEGFLAMLGFGEVKVVKQPIVGILSTGDELIAAGEPLTQGKIFDSNTYTLSALVETCGCVPIDLGIARDSFDDIHEKLDRAITQNANLVISSAGVSVGAFDYVKSVVEEHGEMDFWRVNMRPGKPLAFGRFKEVPFIGLPGNPVSSFVGFEVFVRPALERLAGHVTWKRNRKKVITDELIESDGRETYLRVVITETEGSYIAKLTGHQGSGNLRSLVQANALLLLPSGVKSLPPGSELEAWLFNEKN